MFDLIMFRNAFISIQSSFNHQVSSFNKPLFQLAEVLEGIKKLNQKAMGLPRPVSRTEGPCSWRFYGKVASRARVPGSSLHALFV